jgi:3-phosphoinositide dependent protein kinase-1
MQGERFVMREKEFNMKLNHKNIVRMEGYFQDSHNGYFLFELCKNGDIKKLLDREAVLDIKLVRFYTMEIINVLRYMHKNNIVHRDLKPENMMIDDTFHLKLIDFGAAKVIDSNEASDYYDRNIKYPNSEEDNDFKRKMKEKMVKT